MTSEVVLPEVHYHVEVDPERHELRVRMQLRGPIAQGRIRLGIPTWVPGDYPFATLARDLFDVSAVSTHDEQPLPVTRFASAPATGEQTISCRC